MICAKKSSRSSWPILGWRTGLSWLPALSLISAFCALLLTGCSQRPDPLINQDIVILNIETLRADFTGLHGDRNRFTPRIDSLAANGVVVENAFTVAPWTRPSVGALLTGLYPARHGADEQSPGAGLSKEVTTVAEVLEENGYATFAWMTNSNLAAPLGFDQGFTHFTYTPSEPATNLNRQVLASWDAWRTSLSGDAPPSFLYVHYVEPHNAHFQTAFSDRVAIVDHGTAVTAVRTITPIERVAAIELYGSHVLQVDRAVGCLVDSLRARMPDCIVVITSDHGEEWFDHGGLFHGFTAYEELVRIPLVMLVPNATPRRTTAVSSNIDMMPTLLDLVGIDAPEDIDGRSIAGSIYGSWLSRFVKSRPVFVETKFDQHIIASWEEGAAVMQNMATEEIETSGLASARKKERRLRALEAMRAELAVAPSMEPLEASQPDQAKLAKELRALGYLAQKRDHESDSIEDDHEAADETMSDTVSHGLSPSDWRTLSERYHYIAATDTTHFGFSGTDSVPKSKFPRRVVLDPAKETSVSFILRATEAHAVFFATPWSGIVEITVDGASAERYDLWVEPGTMMQKIVRIEGSYDSEVTIRPSGEKNALSSRPLVYLSGLIVEAQDEEVPQ